MSTSFGFFSVYNYFCFSFTRRRFFISCKQSHTISTASAPGGNVNTRKRKAMIRITELSKPVLIK